MSIEEKLLLLEVLMRDMRGSFPQGNDVRLEKAIAIARELELDGVVKDIERFKEDEYMDGRWFRSSPWGYDYIKSLRSDKDNTIINKSEEFKEEVEWLEFPEYLFIDWESYYKLKLKKYRY